MAIYEFLCFCGNQFELRRPMFESDVPAICDKCGRVAQKLISLPVPGGVAGEVWEYEYTHKMNPKYVRDSKGNKIPFNPNTMRKGRKGSGQ